MNLLRHNAERFPRRCALHDGTRRWSWQSLHETATVAARRLRDAGVMPGDTVATILDNSAAHVMLLHAIWLRGAVASPLNTRLAVPEHTRQLALLRPALLITENEILYREYPTRHPRQLLDADSISGADRTADGEASPVVVHSCHSGPCSVLFTSGTAGAVKAVPHTWENHRASAEGSAANLGVVEDDNWLCVIPLYHIGGLAIVTRSLLYGTAMTIGQSAGTMAMLTLLRESHATLFSVVPTVLQRMIEASPDCTAAALPSLRAILLGGAAASAKLWRQARDRELPVLGTYGLTESCSQVVTASPRELDAMAGTAGRPIGGACLRICDPAGAAVPSGVVGEIQLQGPMLTSGYLDSPARNALAFVDGWFRTGDQGMLDDAGLLHVLGRRDDMIITGGENVHPSEIEEVLLRYPGVRDALVVGIPDEEWGTRIAALLVCDIEPDPDALEVWCRSRLAGYKIPRRWKSVRALPTTGSGKVSRVEAGRLFDGRR